MSEDQALERLSAILARPEFQYEPTGSWWDQVVIFVLKLFLDFVAFVVQNVGAVAAGRTGIIGVVVLILALAVLIAVSLYLARSIRLAVRTESRLRAATLAERRERSDRLWQDAQELARRGDWTAAVRSAYLSALYGLDERALLHVESGLTNREHALRLARQHPDLGATFSELVLRYDRLRYGHTPITADAFGELSGLVERARATSMVGSSA
jgi:hypothetical protein